MGFFMLVWGVGATIYGFSAKPDRGPMQRQARFLGPFFLVLGILVLAKAILDP